MQLKLNEIVAALQGASNRLIDVENLDESELRQLHLFYQTLSRMAKKDGHLGQSHSIDEAAVLHHRKRKIRIKAIEAQEAVKEQEATEEESKSA